MKNEKLSIAIIVLISILITCVFAVGIMGYSTNRNSRRTENMANGIIESFSSFESELDEIRSETKRTGKAIGGIRTSTDRIDGSISEVERISIESAEIIESRNIELKRIYSDIESLYIESRDEDRQLASDIGQFTERFRPVQDSSGETEEN